jgi:hypothetical protein
MSGDQNTFHSPLQCTEKVTMELAVAPPPRVASGVNLGTPLVVTFSGSSVAPEDEQQVDGQAFTLPNLSAIWVFLSLTTANMEETSATRRGDLFCGKRADSMHQLYCEQYEDRPILAYASFPNLVITQPGSYRVKVNVIDMDEYSSATHTSMPLRR